jgi:hypothetical protein
MPSIHTTDKGTMRMPSFQAQVSDEEDPLELLFDHNLQDEQETAENCDSEAMDPTVVQFLPFNISGSISIGWCFRP